MSAFYSPPVFIMGFQIKDPVYFCAEKAYIAIVCTLKHYRHQNSCCQEIFIKKPQKSGLARISAHNRFFVHRFPIEKYIENITGFYSSMMSSSISSASKISSASAISSSSSTSSKLSTNAASISASFKSSSSSPKISSSASS